MPSPSAGEGTPLYVVARTDKVRVYVDVPESQAADVKPGTKARIEFEAQRGDEIEAAVTRTSWSLQFRTRTLRAEIDLPNPGGEIFSGMYAYGHVINDRQDAWAVPVDTVTELGEQECVYLFEGGKAVKTRIQAGIDDGKFIELSHKEIKGRWVPFDGSEQIIQGDLAELTNGIPVDVESGLAKDEAAKH